MYTKSSLSRNEGKLEEWCFLLDDLLGDIIYKYLLCIYIQKRELGGEEIAIKLLILYLKGRLRRFFSRFVKLCKAMLAFQMDRD